MLNEYFEYQEYVNIQHNVCRLKYKLIDKEKPFSGLLRPMVIISRYFMFHEKYKADNDTIIEILKAWCGFDYDKDRIKHIIEDENNNVIVNWFPVHLLYLIRKKNDGKIQSFIDDLLAENPNMLNLEHIIAQASIKNVEESELMGLFYRLQEKEKLFMIKMFNNYSASTEKTNENVSVSSATHFKIA